MIRHIECFLVAPKPTIETGGQVNGSTRFSSVVGAQGL
mgnify:CR=1 FL=1